MPPIRHSSWLPGSGVNRITRAARSSSTLARSMPVSTGTARRSVSIAMRRWNRVVSRTTPVPIAAPDRDVPEARGVMGTSSARHTSRTARMSASESTNATARGSTAHGLASVEYARRLASSVRTFSGPTAFSSDLRRVASSTGPLIRTRINASDSFALFAGQVSPMGGTTFMSSPAFEGSRAHQSRPPPEDGGPRTHGIPSPRLPHVVGPRLGDGEPDLAALEGPANAHLCDDAAAPRKRVRPDLARDAPPLQGGPIRDLPADPRGRHAIPRETNRHRTPRARSRVRDQRATGAGVAGPVRGDLRTEERPGATPEDVRRRDPGGDRHRDDE